MQRNSRISLRWWHHAAIVGALGVGALYLVDYLYDGMLLYYAGPGSAHWLDEIIVSWHLVFGGLLGLGLGVWFPKSLRPVRPTEVETPARSSIVKSPG